MYSVRLVEQLTLHGEVVPSSSLGMLEMQLDGALRKQVGSHG